MDWIQEIKRDENAALKQIYALYRDDVCGWLRKKFEINESDAKEIYQLAVIILYENVISGKLTTLSSDLKSYMIGVSKNKALEIYRKKKKFVSTDVLNYLSSTDTEELEQITLKEKRIEDTLNALVTIGDPCRSLLQRYYFKRQSMEEITSIMGYKNASTTKNLKYKCIKRLQNMLIPHI